MKYNEDLFNISSIFYSKTNIQDNNTNNIELENQLLHILLKKLKEALNDKTTKYNGVLKIRFTSQVFGITDEGYKQIKKLIELDRFDNFANQYCLYIGSNQYSDDGYFSTYYEIIWDYETYFTMLNEKIKIK